MVSRKYFFLLASALLLLANGSGSVIQTDTYSSTGTYDYSIPESADVLNITLVGASGADGGYTESFEKFPGSGGNGGQGAVLIDLSGISHEIIGVGVGEEGEQGADGGTNSGTGGGGGGGSTAVRWESNSNVIACATGGGGGGGTSGGGDGGAGGGGVGLDGEYADTMGGAGGYGYWFECPSGGAGGAASESGEDGALEVLQTSVVTKQWQLEPTGEEPSIEIEAIAYNDPPSAPSLSSPSDGATGTDNSVTLEVGVSDPDGDSMDVSFYWGNGTKITTTSGVASGSTTGASVSGLEWGKQYSWYAVADDGKATNQSSTFSFTTQYAPDLTSGKFIDDRTTSATKLLFGINDYGETDVDTWSGSGNLNSLTNSQLDVNIGLPTSSSYGVTDSYGATSNTYSVDLSEMDSGVREDSYSHSLDIQRINRTVTIFNDAASSIDYELVLDLTGTVVQGQTWTGTISGSSSVTHTAITESDWITGQTENTYNRYSDSDYNHTEDGQRIHNQTELTVDNSRSFTFHSVDLSSICSQTTSSEVSSGTSTVTTDCNRPTFDIDVTTESTGSLREDTSKTHGLDLQYVEKNKTVTETGGYSWSSLTIFAPSIAGSCNDCNARTRDISSTGSVTEVYHSSWDWISGETENDYNEFGENSSAPHTLDTQYNLWKTELVVDNFQSFSFDSVDLSSRCENTVSADIPSGTDVQVTTNCSTVERTGDFITGETEETFSKYSDGDYNQSEDTQRIHNRTKLLVNNSKSYSYTSTDISSTCGKTTSADVPSGNSVQVTDDCNRPTFTGDWISETVSQEYADTGYSHDLDTQKIAKNKTLTEDGGYSWSQVDISPPSISGSCTDCSTRSRDLSASASVKETYQATGDWITNEALGTYNRYSDGDFNHGEDTQRIHNRTELVVDNDKNLKFRDVDLTSTCSRDSSADVPAGTGIRISNDCTRPVFKVDAVNESTSTLYEDTGYSHSLSSQGVAKNKTVNETEGYSFTEVNVSAPSLPGSVVNGGMREVNLSSGAVETEIYNSTGDWIQDEREVQEAFGQDLSRVHDVDQQHLYNQTGLVVNNTRNLSFTSVDLSNRCSLTTAADVPEGESTVTSSCSNETISGDWIKNEENQSTQYSSGPVTVGEDVDKKFTATQYVEAANVRTGTDLQVDLDALLSDLPGCSVVNSTQQEFDADSVSSFTFHKSCRPGNHLNRSAVTKTEASDYYKYEVEFGFEVNSNLTEEQEFRYAVKKNWADNWEERDPPQTEIRVDNSSKDLEVEEEVIDGTEYIVFVVGDNHTNSSIHAGTHSATLTYYEDKSPGTTSGGSSGGTVRTFVGSDTKTQVENVTSDRYNWTVSAITAEDDQTFQLSGYPGSSFEKYVVIENTGSRNVTLDIDCVSRGDSCKWVNLSVDRVILNRNSFSSDNVRISGTIPETFDGEDSPARFSVRVSDPRFNGTESTSEGVGYVDFTVNYSPVFGPALDVATKLFEWRELESPVSFGHAISYPFVLLPLLLSALVVSLASLAEWLIPRDRTYPTVKYSGAVVVFLAAFILL
jgi:hypothetical protein